MGASVGGIFRGVTAVFTLGASELIEVNGSKIGDHVERGIDTNDTINRVVSGIVTGGFSELERVGIGPTAPLKIGADLFGEKSFGRTFQKTSEAIQKADTRRLSSSDYLRLGGTAAGLTVAGAFLSPTPAITSVEPISGLPQGQGIGVFSGTTQVVSGVSSGIANPGLFAGIPLLSALEQGAVNTVNNLRETIFETINNPERIIETFVPGEPTTFDPGTFVLESAPIGTSPKRVQQQQRRSFLMIGVILAAVLIVAFFVLRRRV